MNNSNYMDQMSCNSAKALSDASSIINATAARENAHRRKIEAGAEAAIQQKELLEQQVDLLKDQNKQLSENYDKLKELYDRQVEEADSAKEELRKSKRYNTWMMVITFISMLAAIAGPVISIFD